MDNTILYGFKGGNYKVEDFNIKDNETYFVIKKDNELMEFNTQLLGKHNIYNILVTIIILDNLGYDYNTIKKQISNVYSPNGRMETIKYNDNTIIIDYAHTPDAVSKIISTVKEFNKGNIITIIGCGGNRDKTKRPIMGTISTDLSNHVIFTSDNPRYENELDIINDIIKDLKNQNYEIEKERKEAIKKGIQMLKKNDILLILGKGHENYQIINGEKFHFDDKEEVIKLIRR